MSSLLMGIDARMLGPEQTGIGRYIENLVRELLAIDAAHRYVLFVRPKAMPFLPFPSDRIRIVPVDIHWYSVREQLLLPRIFARERLDLLHVPHFNAPIWYSGRMVVTIHDVTHIFFPRTKRPILKTAAFRFVFQRALAQAQAIIAVSSYTRDAIMKHFAVAEEKIHVIPEGVVKLSHPRDAKTRLAQYGIHLPFLLYVGVWREHKNLVGLLRAFALMKQRWEKPLQLVLVGTQDERYPHVRKTWEQLRLRPYIVTPGFVDESTLAALYQEAELVVIPSFLEGFGFVGLEALHQGTPVAASNQGALPEVLRDAAEYFSPDDPAEMAETIVRVLRDRRLQRSLLKKAKKILLRYTWEKTALKTLDLYETILKKGRKTHP